ncbi:subtilisin-like protein [Anaeromyces robustus]|uniref:Subtilisin-like protein n=1 Tax=Anaeromyces robustus TaxID=1754192 RepID=A0A1Y1X1N4_9FUNG|nr:subtilisin-like protein [Anaeromyces robustus]|eukprot:ORX79575.1 subtilisin-like protein [Anaeromyces robustus]
MNDIYDIISENQDTYVQKDNKQDELLNELKTTSQLKKRYLNKDNKYNKKYLFINRNRPQQNYHFKRSFNSTEGYDEIEKYIPIESKLVSLLCPVLNYYAIRVYLSEEIIKEIVKLPNVIHCEKSTTSENYDYKYNTYNDDINNIYYNREEILKETGWSGLNVQENKINYNLTSSHLSLISQNKANSTSLYDNNYYYPSSSGKGINIYFIDAGLYTPLLIDDFDQYKGTENERTITCDARFYSGITYDVNSIDDCIIDEDIYHGTEVAAVAAGTINGVAKKANIHMLATSYAKEDDLLALEHVKQHGILHKSIINISRGHTSYSKVIQDKIDELIKLGYIIFVAAGNNSMNTCFGNRYYASYNNVISVGAIDNINLKDNMSSIYRRPTWSNYGRCITINAPGYINFVSASNEYLFTDSGTSFSTPIVSGVAATIMSEHPDIEYNYESMRDLLTKDLSLKNIITGLEIYGTPNRFINNGKKLIYEPPRCDDPSGKNKCSKNECCSKTGFCVDPDSNEFSNLKSLCYIENGCHNNYGICHSLRCDHPLREYDCGKDECCSKDGKCVNIFNDSEYSCFIENDCQIEFSDQCLSLEYNEKYGDEYQDRIIDFACVHELEPYQICNFDFDNGFYNKLYFMNKCELYRKAKCEEFFKSPFTYAPSCIKAIKNHKYSLLNSLPLIQMNYIKAAHNLICARMDDQLPESMCNIAEVIFIYRFFYPDKPMLQKACEYETCREAIYNYFNVIYLQYKQITEFNESLKFMEEGYETYLNFLNSEECFSLNNMNIN